VGKLGCFFWPHNRVGFEPKPKGNRALVIILEYLILVQLSFQGSRDHNSGVIKRLIATCSRQKFLAIIYLQTSAHQQFILPDTIAGHVGGEAFFREPVDEKPQRNSLVAFFSIGKMDLATGEYFQDLPKHDLKLMEIFLFVDLWKYDG
jgi:hypothetical protein